MYFKMFRHRTPTEFNDIRSRKILQDVGLSSTKTRFDSFVYRSAKERHELIATLVCNQSAKRYNKPSTITSPRFPVSYLAFHWRGPRFGISAVSGQPATLTRKCKTRTIQPSGVVDPQVTKNPALITEGVEGGVLENTQREMCKQRYEPYSVPAMINLFSSLF